MGERGEEGTTLISADVVAWLMRAETPSIPFLFLRDLLGLSRLNPKVRKAQRAILRTGPVPAILRRQTADGHWRGERSFYTPKFVSTHWSMMLLAELGLDGGHAGVRAGAAHMLAATSRELAAWEESEAGDVSCLWGNILRYVQQAGLGDDPRAKNLLRRVVTGLGRDAWCIHNGNKPCAWGVIRGLWGLAAIPKRRRGRVVDRAIRNGLVFLLERHHLDRADYPVPKGGKINPLWFGLNVPLFYQADILFTLRVLGELDALAQPGAQKALDWLESRRARDGRWRGVSPYRSRTWKALGPAEETSRWTTLYALQVLQRAGRLAL